MKNVLVITFLFSLISCNGGDMGNSGCEEDYHGAYSGVALATGTGDTTFAISKDCVVSVSGSEEYYRQVRVAWQKSPYLDEVRPVYLDVEGQLRYRDQENLAPVLNVTNNFTVSTNFNPEEVTKQFRLRLDRDAPERSSN